MRIGLRLERGFVFFSRTKDRFLLAAETIADDRYVIFSVVDEARSAKRTEFGVSIRDGCLT